MVLDRVCALLESALAGTARRDLIDRLGAAGGSVGGLRRMRDAFRTNLSQEGPSCRELDALVGAADARTRKDGFHVLHDWDGTAGRVCDSSIAVDVAEFTIVQRRDLPPAPSVPAVLLDYYYLNLLALLSLRVWDDGDADENLARLDRLLDLLQGAGGSGHRFASRAATLLLIATAHYEPDERGYGRLLDKVRALGPRQRTAVALDHAVAMGCHLRFGFEATYGRDTTNMRSDNVADYPWLAFALATLMEAYTPGDLAIAEGLVNGLCPDPRAFVGDTPAALASCESDRGAFRERFAAHRRELLEVFECFRPDERVYSPIGLFFNFSHNVVKGAIVDALLTGGPWEIGLNDLFSADSRPRTESNRRIQLATTLMDYARHSPDRIRGKLTPVIVYDPRTGRRAFGHAMRVLKEVT